MTNKIFRWFILLGLFIWFLTQDACAQVKEERKQVTGKIFRFAGTAIVLGTILTLPKKDIGSLPMIGAGIVGVGFAVDIKNLGNKKRRK